MLYQVRAADGQVVHVQAVDWMGAMAKAITHWGIEVSGWMCNTRPDRTIDVFDPMSGQTWHVEPLDESGVPIVTPAPSQPRQAAPPPTHPLAKPVQPKPAPPPRAATTLSLEMKSPVSLQPQPQRSVAAWKPPPGLDDVPEVDPMASAPEDLAEQLFDLSTDILGAGNPNAASKIALDILMKLIPCEAGSVLRGSRRDGELTFVACAGPAARKLLGKKMQLEQGVVGATFDLGIAIQVNDVTTDDRHLARFDKETGFVTRSVLCVPIRQAHAVYGAIELINPKGQFHPWHVDTMETVARTLSDRMA